MQKLEHGIIGNERILALIHPDTAIDWLCIPRFDSPSVFARLLDLENGGAFQLHSAGGDLSGDLTYIRNTNVLRNRVTVSDGEFELIDFAPRFFEGAHQQRPLELVRVLRPLSGRPRLRARFDPRPNYALERPRLLIDGPSLIARSASLDLHLYSSLPPDLCADGGEFVLDSECFFMLSALPRESPPDLAEIHMTLERTIDAWRVWAKTCALPTFAAEAVLRSALCLKLHFSADTGAIIAAATTSIPEAMHTERTWDYRYCWLRDAAFTVEALRRLSHLAEGERFIEYLRNVIDSGPLQPLYGVDGRRDLEEIRAEHLAGFRNNGHVRIGNAAALQKQNDLMGELILCLETFLCDPRIAYESPEELWPLIQRLVEESIEAAPEPDTSIWEFRTRPGHYTFSRAMCWVAMQRGALLATRLGKTAEAERWRGVAEVERVLILDRGYNASAGMFTMTLDGESPDASLLLLPTIGIIDAADPRFVATVENYQRLLLEKGFLLRYKLPDDFGETTSAFTICSFWLCEALALIGRLDDAIDLFNRLLACANPLGLFSEDIEPETRDLLGNFPQAYTHVGLIHAAMTIGELLEARDGRVRAWT